jgi:hypothetical protein
MRYLAPAFLLATLLLSGLLALQNTLYAIVFGAQVVFYSTAGISWCFERVGVRVPGLVLPQYFVITNLASVLAFIKLIRGERYVKWEPLREPLDTTRKVSSPTIFS